MIAESGASGRCHTASSLPAEYSVRYSLTLEKSSSLDFEKQPFNFFPFLIQVWGEIQPGSLLFVYVYVYELT